MARARGARRSIPSRFRSLCSLSKASRSFALLWAERIGIALEALSFRRRVVAFDSSMKTGGGSEATTSLTSRDEIRSAQLVRDAALVRPRLRGRHEEGSELPRG